MWRRKGEGRFVEPIARERLLLPLPVSNVKVPPATQSGPVFRNAEFPIDGYA